MAGNTFGQLFQVTTFGESHGTALGVVVDGCPPGLALTRQEIQRELDRRRPGQSRVTTSRQEPDQVEILSGVFEGKTLGTPIALLIRNRDAAPGAYDNLRHRFRPGHADLTYFLKYGRRDHRGGGRASGRETAGRVAAGAIAKKLLSRFGVRIAAGTIQIGKLRATKFDPRVIEKNQVRCPDAKAAPRLIALVERARKNGDSVGGVVEVRAAGAPAGLGEPVFGKLDADLAGALMSIGGVKGVEIGDGFAAASRLGSDNADPVRYRRGKFFTRHNRGGGILGGISTGEDIICRLAIKPTSSIALPQKTVTENGKPVTIQVQGRHDPCLCPRIVPVAEAMVALVLADHLLRHRAQVGFKK
jgi:chorismate synthase